MTPQAAAALIAAVALVVGAGLNEAFRRTQQRKEDRKTAEKIYARYADPISNAAANLFWRLKEVFDGNSGGHYLERTEDLSPYELYKATSTLYRIAAFLAWLHALRRELFYLPNDSPELIQALDEKLYAVDTALADGSHVEVVRAEALIGLWGLPKRTDTNIEALATKLDYTLSRHLQQRKLQTAEMEKDDNAIAVCRACADVLTAELATPQLSDDLLNETRVRAVSYLSVRQRWIYRDWQAAIGSILLREVSEGERRYDVIGFGEFERMCSEGTKDQRKWLSRLAGLTYNLDVGGDPARDARIGQLRGLYLALANVITAIHESNPNRRAARGPVLDAARNVIRHGK